MNLTKPTNKKQRVKVIFKCTCYERGGAKDQLCDLLSVMRVHAWHE